MTQLQNLTSYQVPIWLHLPDRRVPCGTERRAFMTTGWPHYTGKFVRITTPDGHRSRAKGTAAVDCSFRLHHVLSFIRDTDSSCFPFAVYMDVEGMDIREATMVPPPGTESHSHINVITFQDVRYDVSSGPVDITFREERGSYFTDVAFLLIRKQDHAAILHEEAQHWYVEFNRLEGRTTLASHLQQSVELKDARSFIGLPYSTLGYVGSSMPGAGHGKPHGSPGMFRQEDSHGTPRKPQGETAHASWTAAKSHGSPGVFRQEEWPEAAPEHWFVSSSAQKNFGTAAIRQLQEYATVHSTFLPIPLLQFLHDFQTQFEKRANMTDIYGDLVPAKIIGYAMDGDSSKGRLSRSIDELTSLLQRFRTGPASASHGQILHAIYRLICEFLSIPTTSIEHWLQGAPAEDQDTQARGLHLKITQELKELNARRTAEALHCLNNGTGTIYRLSLEKQERIMHDITNDLVTRYQHAAKQLMTIGITMKWVLSPSFYNTSIHGRKLTDPPRDANRISTEHISVALVTLVYCVRRLDHCCHRLCQEI